MVLVRWDFGWKGTEEIQSVSCWGKVTQEGTAGFPDWQPLVDALSEKGCDAWSTQMGASGYSLGVKALRCVAYHYSQDHKDVLHRGEHAFDPDYSWAGTAASSLPPQNTIVLSLYAFDPAGFAQQRARKRGRMYLPTPAPAQLDGTGTLTDGATIGWVTMAKNFFNAMTGELELPDAVPTSHPRWRPYVSSVAGQASYKVTHVRVGSTVDTQRRRRNQLPERYQALPINT